MMTNMTSGTLEFGPYRLKSEPYRLWRGPEEIALRPKSLKVLAYLARRPGRLVSKDELGIEPKLDVDQHDTEAG